MSTDERALKRARRPPIHRENDRMFITWQAIAWDEGGATMVEYGLLVALVTMVALVAITTLGTNLSALFSAVASSI